MLGFFVVPAVLLVLAVGLFFLVRKRSARHSGQHLGDLSPVSGQWLADYRRSG